MGFVSLHLGTQNGTSKTKTASISVRGPNEMGRLLTDIFYKPFASVWKEIKTFNFFSIIEQIRYNLKEIWKTLKKQVFYCEKLYVQTNYNKLMLQQNTEAQLLCVYSTVQILYVICVTLPFQNKSAFCRGTYSRILEISQCVHHNSIFTADSQRQFYVLWPTVFVSDESNQI